MELTKRQNEIIDAAVRLIARRGIQELTIKNLAAEIGVTEPALYRHFANVIVSSHQAFFTAEAERNIAGTTMKSFGDFAAGRTLENSICLHCDGQKQCPGRKPGAPCPAHPR